MLHISVLGDLELCFGGAKPTKSPHVEGQCSETSACFLMQLTRKRRLHGLRDIPSLQDMSNFLFKHDRAQTSQRIQVVPILLQEAKAMLGLFCFQLNTIG